MDLIITVTLFAADGKQQLCMAMVKMGGKDPLSKVTSAFCRWTSLAAGSVSFHLNGQLLDESATAQQLGLTPGTAVHARLEGGAQLTAQLTTTLLDVTDSELAALADCLQMAK